MRRKKQPHKNKRRGLSLKPLIIGMSACVVLLGGVLLWAVLGSVRLEPESGHGLGIVDAVNTMGLQKKTQELAAKPSAASSESQTLTANETDAEEIKDKEAEDQKAEQTLEEESTKALVYQQIIEATMANSKSGVADVTQLTDVAADDVRLWIEAYTYGNWPYLEGEPVTKEAQDEILARRNLEGILDPITLKYGVITQNAAVRAFPTWKKASTSLDAHSFDYFQESMLMTGEAAVIVHQTADGIWSFVQAQNYRGWVETDKIACCTLDELKKWQETKRAVVTDARLTLAGTNVTLRMGTALPAKEESEGILMVSIPQKDDKGQLVITNVETAQDGIHFGYLDMTQENILDQAKKLVGMAYGWGDSNGDMDCSSTMNAIYRCFGIILPRNTGSMAQTGTQIVSLEGMTQEEKLEKIQSMKPGTLLVMKNHVVMYIGQENGEDLILHNFTTCMAEDGVSTKEVYQCQITQLNLVTAAGTQYLDAYATAICFPED